MTSSSPSQRQLRVGEIVRHAVAEMLTKDEVQDTSFDMRLITVPEVKMSPDLKHATVYVMPLGGRDEQRALQALERNRRFVRGVLAKKVKMKFLPDLHFKLDDTFERGEKIDRLLRSIPPPNTSRKHPTCAPTMSRSGEPDLDGGGQVGGISLAQAGGPHPLPSPKRSRFGFAQAGNPPPNGEGKRSKPRREKNAIHGWLVLDKPQGMTSTQAVAMVKRVFSPEKAGHAGTLDPLATGILPIALGEATKTVSYAMDGLKTYSFTVRWGVERDTDDAEGEITQTSPARPRPKDIEARLSQFRGRISQIPPRFSAIKVHGERAYDIARDGEVIDLKPREVFVESLELDSCPDEDTAIFHCTCGKGTYVRSLARDLGRLLGCFGHVIALRRTRVGPFGEAQAMTEAQVKAGQEDKNALQSLLLPVATVLDDIPALAVTHADADRLRQGQPVLLHGRGAPLFEGAAYASCQGRLIALGFLEQGQFSPTRVFNLNGPAAAVPKDKKEFPDVDYARAQTRSG